MVKGSVEILQRMIAMRGDIEPGMRNISSGGSFTFFNNHENKIDEQLFYFNKLFINNSRKMLKDSGICVIIYKLQI